MLSEIELVEYLSKNHNNQSCFKSFLIRGFHGEWPHSSDAAQRYILKEMKSAGAEAELEDVVDISASHGGQCEWGVGEVFEDSVLKEFDVGEHQDDVLEEPAYGLKALGDVYGVIEMTSDGNNRLEGLRALDIGWDFPVDGRTARDWKENYRDAELFDMGGRVTPEGKVFLDTDSRDYELENVGVESLGEVYRDLTTKKVGDRDRPTGQKLEALFLYSAGMSHRDVGETTGPVQDSKELRVHDAGLSQCPLG